MGSLTRQEQALAPVDGSALGRFLTVAEVWETRPERLSPEAQQLALDASGLTLIVGLVSLGATAVLRHANLSLFFWIDAFGRLERGLIGLGVWLSIVLIALGAVGFMLWWIFFERETGAATRYFVVGEVAVLGLSLSGEAFVLFFLILQLLLWIVVAVLVLVIGGALLFGLISSLGS